MVSVGRRGNQAQAGSLRLPFVARLLLTIEIKMHCCNSYKKKQMYLHVYFNDNNDNKRRKKQDI